MVVSLSLQRYRKSFEIKSRLGAGRRHSNFSTARKPMPVLKNIVPLPSIDIHETNALKKARNFHLPDGTTLVTMHPSLNLDLDMHSLELS